MGGWRTWLINRFTITFAVITLTVLAWNVYVRQHNGGILEGTVVDASGHPVADATVVLNEQTLVSLTPIAETTTNNDGEFSFLKHDRHKVVITAEKDGTGASERVLVRLYFRNENRRLKQPISLQPQP